MPSIAYCDCQKFQYKRRGNKGGTGNKGCRAAVIFRNPVAWREGRRPRAGRRHDPDRRCRKVPFVDTLIIETSGRGLALLRHCRGLVARSRRASARRREARAELFTAARRSARPARARRQADQHLRLARPQGGARTGGGGLGSATGRDRRIATSARRVSEEQSTCSMGSSPVPTSSAATGWTDELSVYYSGLLPVCPRPGALRLYVRRCRRFSGGRP